MTYPSIILTQMIHYQNSHFNLEETVPAFIMGAEWEVAIIFYIIRNLFSKIMTLSDLSLNMSLIMNLQETILGPAQIRELQIIITMLIIISHFKDKTLKIMVLKISKVKRIST